MIYREVRIIESAGSDIIESDRTLSKSVAKTIYKISKTGPKDSVGVNKIIILLPIPFRKCLGKEHYHWIADLLNLYPEIYGGEKVTEGSIKNKFLRLKKSKDWNQKCEYYLPNWKEYYSNQPSPSRREGWYIFPNWEAFYLDRYSRYNQDAKESGLSELVKRSLSKYNGR